MWVSRSLENLSSRTRAFFGRLRGVDSDYADEYSDDDCMALESPRGLDSECYDKMSVETGAGRSDIFVTKPSEAAYFEHDEVFEPVMMGAARPDVEVDDIVEPLAKKEKVASGEPADLFINAIRRPPYQKFDSSAPVIKKKVVAEPAPAPIEVEPVIEQVVFEAEDMAEVTPAVVAPEILAEEVDTVIEDFVISAPAAPAEAPVEENLEIPIINIPAAAEEPDPVLMETLEVDDSRVECEISHEVIEQASAEVLPVAQKFEIGDEVFDMSAIDFVEAPYTAPQAPAEKFEIGDEVFDMAFMDVEETPCAAPAPMFALPAPKTVVRSLPAKLDIEEMDKAESVGDDTVVYSGVEMAETSGSTMEDKRTEEFTVAQVATLPVMVINEDRDVLFAFRNELEADEAEFISTSYDDNLAIREDYLDRTECTFKFRAKIERPRFDGNLRSLFSY